MGIVAPRAPGEKGRVNIGPGQVAHVAVAETLVRKKLADIELDLCYRQGRPVPPELKIPVSCKFFDLGGSCSLGGKCQYAHGPEELEVAQRMAIPRGAQGGGMDCRPVVLGKDRDVEHNGMDSFGPNTQTSETSVLLQML